LAGAITGGIGLFVSVALLVIVGTYIFSHRSEIDRLNPVSEQAPPPSTPATCVSSSSRTA